MQRTQNGTTTTIRVTKATHEILSQLASLEDRSIGRTVARLVREAADAAGIVQPKRTGRSVRRGQS